MLDNPAIYVAAVAIIAVGLYLFCVVYLPRALSSLGRGARRLVNPLRMPPPIPAVEPRPSSELSARWQKMFVGVHPDADNARTSCMPHVNRHQAAPAAPARHSTGRHRAPHGQPGGVRDSQLAPQR